MRLFEFLFEIAEMPRDKALAVFKKLGIDVRRLTPEQLKKVRKDLVKKYHPDVGGNLPVVQEINAAYDALVKNSVSGGYNKQEYERNANTAWDEYYRQQRAHDEERDKAWWDDWDRRTQETARKRREEEEKSGREEELRKKEQQYPKQAPWSWAGWSGGIPNNDSIRREDYTDVNYIKKRMWELRGKSSHEYTIWAYDGAFFRGVTTVFGSNKIFNEMAKAMIQWNRHGGNPYDTRAVFVSDSKKPSTELLLIYRDGVFYGDRPILFEHNRFNKNPGNDQQFMWGLSEKLDRLKANRENNH